MPVKAGLHECGQVQELPEVGMRVLTHRDQSIDAGTWMLQPFLVWASLSEMDQCAVFRMRGQEAKNIACDELLDGKDLPFYIPSCSPHIWTGKEDSMQSWQG